MRPVERRLHSGERGDFSPLWYRMAETRFRPSAKRARWKLRAELSGAVIAQNCLKLSALVTLSCKNLAATIISLNRLQPMETKSLRYSQELRKLATELRDDARHADMPGYAPKLIHAAEDLERRATVLETLYPDGRHTITK